MVLSSTDLISILLAMFTAVQALTAVVTIIKVRQSSERLDQEKASQARKEAAEQASRESKEDAERRVAAHVRELEDNRRFLELHEAITRPDVLELRIGGTFTEHDKYARKAVIDRALNSVQRLQYETFADQSIVDFVTKELGLASAELEKYPEFRSTNEMAREVVRADYSKYVWGESGKLTKIVTLQLVARALAKSNSVTTTAGFVAAFEPFLKATLAGSPDLLAKWDRDRVLVPASKDVNTERWTKAADSVAPGLGGAMTFDRKEYVVDWWVGFPNAPSVGATVHKPLLEHFRTLDDPTYPISPA